MNVYSKFFVLPTPSPRLNSRPSPIQEYEEILRNGIEEKQHQYCGVGNISLFLPRNPPQFNQQIAFTTFHFDYAIFI